MFFSSFLLSHPRLPKTPSTVGQHSLPGSKSLNTNGNAALVMPNAPLHVASTGPTSLPGKLQQAAETVKETKAEPTQPRRKKLADLEWGRNMMNFDDLTLII